MYNSNLKAGVVYPFRMIKTTSLSEGDHYLVLESPTLSRHLLDLNLYPALRFKKEEFIRCRIDKINCSGKLFLEPENPDYMEGNDYPFIYDHNEEITNSLGVKQIIAVLRGKNGEKAVMPLDGENFHFKMEEIISGHLIRIKKGILILHQQRDLSDQYEFNGIYPFRVIKEGINHKNNSVFIVSDSGGREFSIQKDNYQYYGIKIGNELQCKITGYNVDGRCTLEPLHPYLREGKVYAFRWLRKETFNKFSGEVHEIHIVTDYRGNEQVVAPVDDILLKAFKTPVEFYRIERIHKGKLVLIPQP